MGHGFTVRCQNNIAGRVGGDVEEEGSESSQHVGGANLLQSHEIRSTNYKNPIRPLFALDCPTTHGSSRVG